MSFLDEAQGLQFPIPEKLAKELKPFDKLESEDDRSTVQADCTRWQVTALRSGFNKNKAKPQLCVNLGAKGIAGTYKDQGEVAIWLSVEQVNKAGSVQRQIANSLANACVGWGISTRADWTDGMSGKQILETLNNVIERGKDRAKGAQFTANLVFSRRFYIDNKTSERVNKEEQDFQFIKDAAKAV